MIVDETADLKLAIPAIVFGAVGTAGQRCTSTRRVFIHESIFDDVLAKLVTAYGQVEKKIGDPTDPANLMGPLNSSNAVDAYLDAIEKAKAAGGTVASRSEEHTSELQSLMRISYAVFCLKKQTHTKHTRTTREYHNRKNEATN